MKFEKQIITVPCKEIITESFFRENPKTAMMSAGLIGTGAGVIGKNAFDTYKKSNPQGNFGSFSKEKFNDAYERAKDVGKDIQKQFESVPNNSTVKPQVKPQVETKSEAPVVKPQEAPASKPFDISNVLPNNNTI